LNNICKENEILETNDIYYEQEYGILIATGENLDISAKMGSLINVFDPEIMGFLTLYERKLVDNSNIPKLIKFDEI
jgi:hypothetical protein